MFEGKERRLELIKELRTDEELEDEEEDEEAALQADALSGVADAIQAELVGTGLDEMSKELRRFKEERRVAELVREAERVRRVREAEESSRRQREMARRA